MDQRAILVYARMGFLRWVARGQAWTNQLALAVVTRQADKSAATLAPEFIPLFKRRAIVLERGEPFTTLDLLTCLLEVRAVQQAIVGAGLPLVQLTRALAAQPSVKAQDVDVEETAFTYILGAAGVHTQSSGHSQVKICELLVRIAIASELGAANAREENEGHAAIAASAASAVLRASGLDPDALLWYLAHGANTTAQAAGIGWFMRRRLRWRLTPGMHHVIMHNDDYTSRDFVVHVLHHHFALHETTAQQLMQKVHREGLASVAILPLLQATEQIRETMRYAREQKFPFRLSLYPEGGVALAIARDIA